MKKEVRIIEDKHGRTFITDKDGLTAKDFTILTSLGVMFGLVVVGAVKELALGGITDTYVELVKTIVPVVATAVGGVYGVQAVQSFRRKEREETEYESYK